MKNNYRIVLLYTIAIALFACQPSIDNDNAGELPAIASSSSPTQEILPTPFPTRPIFFPGELVEYIAQNGDTLPALAAHFNTSIDEIRTANSILPDDVTTLPAGLPLQIPIYYRPFWGSPLQIIPDSHFINGPAAVEFDTSAFVNSRPGWLKDYAAYAGEKTRTGADIVDYVATNFSVSPRVLLALLEYQSNAISSQIVTSETKEYPLGHIDESNRSLYLQLVWAANILNNGYYGWKGGELISFDLADGRIVQPDPWQNSATVALQYYINEALEPSTYLFAIGPDGFAKLYSDLFGQPWESEAHIPGSLRQPELQLPFEPNTPWTLTGGPHVGWGAEDGRPKSALDLAPPSQVKGCVKSDEWATAISSGVVVRSERGQVALDLEGDGDERTGWVIFYLHIETRERVAVGDSLLPGDFVGHPSCEGGIATGSHAHIARKYNGEWIPAAGVIPFVMDDWVPFEGSNAYEGGLTRFGRRITACECSSEENQITSSQVLESNP
ncbi:MAG: LysM peptidoglycan-binding domain-containing protein [Chloroflexota bacterium]